VEGGSRSLIYEFQCLLLGSAEKNQERLIQVTLPGFKLRTSRLQVFIACIILLSALVSSLHFLTADRPVYSTDVLTAPTLTAHMPSALVLGYQIRKNVIMSDELRGIWKC
jgi:hypothetical protein